MDTSWLNLLTLLNLPAIVLWNMFWWKRARKKEIGSRKNLVDASAARFVEPAELSWSCPEIVVQLLCCGKLRVSLRVIGSTRVKVVGSSVVAVCCSTFASAEARSAVLWSSHRYVNILFMKIVPGFPVQHTCYAVTKHIVYTISSVPESVHIIERSNWNGMLFL